MDGAAAEALVLKTQNEGVVTLRLNRRARFNPLSNEMIAELQQQFALLAQDESARVIILAAEGRAFCAGHDLREMRANPDEAGYRALFEQCSKMMLALRALPQPVIAQVQGVATAAGCQLVAMCDLAVAADSARLAVSGVNLGLFCSTPAVALSRNVPVKRAMEMLCTGDFIDAATAMEWGLLNRVVPAAELEQATQDLALKIAAKPAAALAIGKRMFYRQLEMGMAAAYQLAGQAMACNMMQDCALDGIQAFLDKR